LEFFMADRFLKHLPTGAVYIWQAHWAADPAMVEVADLAGTPIPDTTVPPEPAPVKKPRKSGLAKPPETLDDIDAALSQDASRGLS
jgi:hypothetical protein